MGKQLQPQRKNGTAEEQLLRQKILREACLGMNYAMDPVPGMDLTREGLKTLETVLVITELKLMYCYVPKAGCTSWKTQILAMVGELNASNGKIHDRISDLFPSLSMFPLDTARYIIKSYNSFMFSRNPFTRILSAFRDKIMLDGNDKWRRELYHWLDWNYPNEARNHHPWRKNFTFTEFVRFYLSSREKNEHWKEIHSLCHPCALRYKFIGHFDTMQEDSAYLLKSIKTDRASELPRKQKITNSSQTNSLREYYSQLPQAWLLRLIQDLEIQRDMKLFGYDVPDVIKKLAYGTDLKSNSV